MNRVTVFFHRSHEYKDEMCLSAVLLYMATNNPQYLTEAQAFYNDYNHDSVPWAFDWDDKTVLCEVCKIYTWKNNNH